jgi:hypothetical protein
MLAFDMPIAFDHRLIGCPEVLSERSFSELGLELPFEAG